MMRTVSICALFFLGGVLAVSQPVTADEPPVDEQALQEALEVVKKIQARYEK